MRKNSPKTCPSDTQTTEIKKTIQAFERKLGPYIIFAFVYGFVFINYIDVISGGYEGYHLWLIFMYFLPFAALTIFYPRNWQLTIGLGLIVSLMNDLFYGVIRNMMGVPLDLTWYYNRWLIPGNAQLFNLNLGFATWPVYSWMMATSIYVRIFATVLLIQNWRSQTQIKCKK